MRQPFVGLVLAAIIGIVVADYLPAITVSIFLIAIAGALAALRWRFPPLVFAVVGATFFVLHSARITNTPANEIQPRVSPDGARVLFVSDRDSEDRDLERNAPNFRGMRRNVGGAAVERSMPERKDAHRARQQIERTGKERETQ